jgi:hypothetical protein
MYLGVRQGFFYLPYMFPVQNMLCVPPQISDIKIVESTIEIMCCIMGRSGCLAEKKESDPLMSLTIMPCFFLEK